MVSLRTWTLCLASYFLTFHESLQLKKNRKKGRSDKGEYPCVESSQFVLPFLLKAWHTPSPPDLFPFLLLRREGRTPHENKSSFQSQSIRSCSIVNFHCSTLIKRMRFRTDPSLSLLPFSPNSSFFQTSTLRQPTIHSSPIQNFGQLLISSSQNANLTHRHHFTSTPTPFSSLYLL